MFAERRIGAFGCSPGGATADCKTRSGSRSGSRRTATTTVRARGSGASPRCSAGCGARKTPGQEFIYTRKRDELRLVDAAH